MKNYTFKLQWLDEDSGYIATVSEFEGVSGFGETADEALKEIKSGLAGVMEVMQKKGEKL